MENYGYSESFILKSCYMVYLKQVLLQTFSSASILACPSHVYLWIFVRNIWQQNLSWHMFYLRQSILQEF